MCLQRPRVLSFSPSQKHGPPQARLLGRVNRIPPKRNPQEPQQAIQVIPSAKRTPLEPTWVCHFLGDPPNCRFCPVKHTRCTTDPAPFSNVPNGRRDSRCGSPARSCRSRSRRRCGHRAWESERRERAVDAPSRPAAGLP